MKQYLIELAPALISLCSAVIACLITLLRTSTDCLVKKLNKLDGQIDRKAITDPTGYYGGKVELPQNVHVYVYGKEVDKNAVTFKYVENKTKEIDK